MLFGYILDAYRASVPSSLSEGKGRNLWSMCMYNAGVRIMLMARPAAFVHGNDNIDILPLRDQ
jgi:hypothetical protein